MSEVTDQPSTDNHRPATIDQQPSARPSDMITFKRSHFYMAFALLAFLCGLAVGYLAWGRREPTVVTAAPTTVAPAATTMPQAAPRSAEQIQRFDVSTDDDPFLGPEQAPVTIIEFSDFECTYCVRFYQDTLVPLLEEYPREVRLVYRDFPLVSIHSNAKPAAEAAQCAFAQGKFWEFHNQLFENQSRLGENLYVEIASHIGLDVDAFEQCYQSAAFSEEVTKDFSAARALGVTGTPTFFINGRPLVGAQPMHVFAAMIEEELSATNR